MQIFRESKFLNRFSILQAHFLYSSCLSVSDTGKIPHLTEEQASLLTEGQDIEEVDMSLGSLPPLPPFNKSHFAKLVSAVKAEFFFQRLAEVLN